MGGFSDYLEKTLLNHVFGGLVYTPPAKLYVGVSLTPIQDDGTGISEPSAAHGYSRVEIDNIDTSWKEAVVVSGVGRKSNDIEITFPEASGNWGTITHFFISDSLAGGNVLGYGVLDTARELLSGDIAKFLVGTLVITLD